jgi:hypothetical protein
MALLAVADFCDLAASRAEISAREAKARLRRSRKRVDAEVFEYQEIARHFRALATELRQMGAISKRE